MSTSDIFVEKGKKLGVEIGAQKACTKIIQNLIRVSALSDEQIASATDVSMEFVAQLRSNLNSEK